MKDDNRVSEQTFRVAIVVSDPPSVRPATLDTGGDWDYRVAAVGQTSILADILPAQQSIQLAFSLNGDGIPEGLEGFQLTANVETRGGFPQFLLPFQTNATAFQSTTITIIDDDGKSNYQQLAGYLIVPWENYM